MNQIPTSFKRAIQVTLFLIILVLALGGIVFWGIVVQVVYEKNTKEAIYCTSASYYTIELEIPKDAITDCKSDGDKQLIDVTKGGVVLHVELKPNDEDQSDVVFDVVSSDQDGKRIISARFVDPIVVLTIQMTMSQELWDEKQPGSYGVLYNFQKVITFPFGYKISYGLG